MMSAPQFPPIDEMAVTPAADARSVFKKRREGFSHRPIEVRRFHFATGKRFTARFQPAKSFRSAPSILFSPRTPTTPPIQTP
jgi:hypothetical protein